MNLYSLTALASLTLLTACLTTGSKGYDSTNEITAEDSSLVRLARSTAAAGDKESAVTILRQGIKATPDRPGLYVELSDLLTDIGRNNEAIATLEQGNRMVPNHPSLARKLGNAYLTQGQSEKALVIYDKALSSNPSDIRLLNSKAIALDMLGNKKESLQVYQSIIKVDPDNVTALNNLAMSHITSGEYMQARGYLEKAAMSTGANPQVRQNLAMVYALTGEKEKARRMGLQDLSEAEVRHNLSVYSAMPATPPASVSNTATPVVSKPVEKATEITPPPTPAVELSQPPAPPQKVAAESSQVVSSEPAKDADKKPLVKIIPDAPSKLPEKIEGTEASNTTQGTPLDTRKPVFKDNFAIETGTAQDHKSKNFWQWLAGKSDANKVEKAPKQPDNLAVEKSPAEVRSTVAEKIAEPASTPAPALAAVKNAPTVTKPQSTGTKVLWEKPLDSTYKPDSVAQNNTTTSEAKKIETPDQVASPLPVENAMPKPEPVFLRLGIYNSKQQAITKFDELKQTVKNLSGYMPEVYEKDGYNLLVGPFMYHEQYAKLCQELLQSGKACEPYKIKSIN